MSEWIKADVYFQDEAPRIGCGWRRCDVKIDRVWIRIRERATGRRAKLPKRLAVGQKARTRVVDTLTWIGYRPVD